VSQAFWHGCTAGQRRAAEYLLSRGADLNWEPDYAHGTPLDAAGGHSTQQENVITWLRELGARSASSDWPDQAGPAGPTGGEPGLEITMPTGIGRDEVQALTGQGAQLVEVLPADEYDWAHLPGAVSLPLKELDARASQLDRSRPVIVYCHDWYWDISPRAAWRLEAAGFGPVHDYTAGKADWLAADLPFEGMAQLAGMYTRRGVATVAERATAAEALRLLDTQGFGPVVVVNQVGVVMGAAYRDKLTGATEGAAVATVMRFAVSTVRPSQDAAALAHRMGDRGVTRTVVTRPDGTLVGLFFAADKTP
jgi:rhodanese-related sulfurtransferase/CBS domain-containing protein